MSGTSIKNSRRTVHYSLHIANPQSNEVASIRLENVLSEIINIQQTEFFLLFSIEAVTAARSPELEFNLYMLINKKKYFVP